MRDNGKDLATGYRAAAGIGPPTSMPVPGSSSSARGTTAGTAGQAVPDKNLE